jgi:hypothetical protein
VSDHRILVEVWKSELQRAVSKGTPPGVRWLCSCGRLGPFVPMAKDAAMARKTAERGGTLHRAAQNRIQR